MILIRKEEEGNKRRGREAGGTAEGEAKWLAMVGGFSGQEESR